MNSQTTTDTPGSSSREEGIRLRVRDLMTERIFAVHADDDLETVHELMMEHHVRHVPVVDDEGLLVGLISHRDLLRHSLIEQDQVPSYVEQALLRETLAREVMTRSPDTTTAEADIRVAAQIMLDQKYGCLPVVEGSRLVGILTEADFVRLPAEVEPEGHLRYRISCPDGVDCRRGRLVADHRVDHPGLLAGLRVPASGLDLTGLQPYTAKSPLSQRVRILHESAGPPARPHDRLPMPMPDGRGVTGSGLNPKRGGSQFHVSHGRKRKVFAGNRRPGGG